MVRLTLTTNLQSADLVIFGVLVFWWQEILISHQITKSPNFTKKLNELLSLNTIFY
jgi:hypothetical protein